MTEKDIEMEKLNNVEKSREKIVEDMCNKLKSELKSEKAKEN